MKILHIIQDEKFPDSASELFEAVAPNQNTYMLPGKKGPVRNLSKIEPVRVFKFAFLSKRFIRYLSTYDAVVLHSLSPFSLEVLARIEIKVPIVWIGMGYDYYDLISGNANQLLKSETWKLCNTGRAENRRGLIAVLKDSARSFLYPNAINKRNVVKRLDLFAPVLEGEHAMVKAVVGEPFPHYIRWNYGKIADLIDGKLGGWRINGTNILVGNSAAPTNNHVEAFRLLAKNTLPQQSKVIVPLSYGDPDYKRHVMNEGQRLFGPQFVPITDFMPLDKYIELLSSCSIVVMNHLRQQAAGNLFISLYLGATVYLDPANPLYREFVSMALTVKPLSELTTESLNHTLEPETVSKHQKVLKKARGRAALEKCTENLIVELTRLRKRN